MYEAHGRAIRAFFGSRLWDAAAVDDLCQETFLAALRSGVPEDKARPWLFGIARNKLLKFLRDKKSFAPLDEARTTPLRDEEFANRDRRAQRARRAVQTLEPQLREVIMLRYWGAQEQPPRKLTYQEIAAHLGIEHHDVQNRLKRARAQLRELLRGEEGDHEA